MLEVDLAQVMQGPVDTVAEVPPTDPLFQGLEFPPGDPVRVRGRLQSTGEGRYYWRATVATVVAAECRRCLAAVRLPVSAQVEALFTEAADAEEDPAAYPIPHRAQHVDLKPAVREELILVVPAYVLCRDDCRGLCPRCGADLNAGPCPCPPAEGDPRWESLRQTQSRLR
ncbi:MAG: YceD family protein [Gemmatimonadales bacterium]